MEQLEAILEKQLMKQMEAMMKNQKTKMNKYI